MDINKYVESYVTENQGELHSNWFKRWYDNYNSASLAEETTPMELASFVFLRKPDATINEIVRSYSSGSQTLNPI